MTAKLEVPQGVKALGFMNPCDAKLRVLSAHLSAAPPQLPNPNPKQPQAFVNDRFWRQMTEMAVNKREWRPTHPWVESQRQERDKLKSAGKGAELAKVKSP